MNNFSNPQRKNHARGVYLDADIFIGFFKADALDLLFEVFDKRCYITPQVFSEIAKRSDCYEAVCTCIEEKKAHRISKAMFEKRNQKNFDYLLTKKIKKYNGVIQNLGRGEASILSAAHNELGHDGLIVSNNTIDIYQTLEKYHLERVSFTHILHYAYEHKIATCDQINTIWTKMLDEGIWISKEPNFQSYLKTIGTSIAETTNRRMANAGQSISYYNRKNHRLIYEKQQGRTNGQNKYYQQNKAERNHKKEYRTMEVR